MLKKLYKWKLHQHREIITNVIFAVTLNAFVSEIWYKNDIIEKLSIIGGGYRNTYRCPNCGSNDRTRLIYFYISKFINVINKTNILHVAPEVEVEKYLEKSLIFIYQQIFIVKMFHLILTFQIYVLKMIFLI